MIFLTLLLIRVLSLERVTWLSRGFDLYTVVFVSPVSSQSFSRYSLSAYSSPNSCLIVFESFPVGRSFRSWNIRVDRLNDSLNLLRVIWWRRRDLFTLKESELESDFFLWSLSLLNVNIKLDSLWTHLGVMLLWLSLLSQYKWNLKVQLHYAKAILFGEQFCDNFKQIRLCSVSRVITKVSLSYLFHIYEAYM